MIKTFRSTGIGNEAPSTRRPPKSGGARRKRRAACSSGTAGFTAGRTRRWEKGTDLPATMTQAPPTFSGPSVPLAGPIT